jgi:hypothetical protein
VMDHALHAGMASALVGWAVLDAYDALILLVDMTDYSDAFLSFPAKLHLNFSRLDTNFQ